MYLLIIYLLALFTGKKQAHSPREQRDPKNKENQIAPQRTVAELQTPVPITVHAETREHKGKWEKVKPFFEIVGIGAVVWYACITHSMWKEMQEQTRIQRNTGINTERAWVGLDVPITLDRIEPQSGRVAIQGHYSIKNFGHGPAFKVIQAGDFLSYPSDPKMARREADFYCDSSVKFATGTVPVGGELKQSPPFGYTLFPSQGHDETIDGQWPIDTLKFFQFVGCIAYVDQFEGVHWTRFCMWRRPGDVSKVPKLEFCSLYNDTDKPKEQ